MFDVAQPPNIIPTGDNLGWLYCSFTPKACDFDNLELTCHHKSSLESVCTLKAHLGNLHVCYTVYRERESSMWFVNYPPD